MGQQEYMKGYKLFQKITGSVISGSGLLYGSYAYGNHNSLKKLEKPEGWQNLPTESRHRLFGAAAQTIRWSELETTQVRQLLPDMLDAAKVPHGDMAVPSKIVHSRRYLISQWQRAAVGACVMVLGTDDNADICVAVGNQRGLLRHPQGYMEVRLPKEDLTGLRAKNASRINAQTGEAVPMDNSIEDNAVREVHEEIGLTISKSQLRLIGIKSAMQDNPVSVAAKYYVLLQNTPSLNTLDHEFADDDLSKPQWVKVKNIVLKEGKYYAHPNPLPFDSATIEQLNAALQATGNTELSVCDEHDSGISSFRP